MKKHLILIVLLFFVCSIYAQTESKTDTIPDGWETNGKITLLINLLF